MLNLSPKYLKRYRDLAWLLHKYGHADLVAEAGLADEFPEACAVPPGDHGGRITGDRGPEQLTRDLESLGPAYIKLGQLLSGRADLLPPPYLDALSRLEDDAEAVEWSAIEQVFEHELGVKASKVFAEINPRPLATASLGQVHLARMRDGRAVVVKVQRPGIRAQLLEDLDAFDQLAEFLSDHSRFGQRYQLTQLARNLRESLLKELNYTQEAHNAQALKHNLARFQRIVVPEVIATFTTSRVLTMEYIPGSKITTLSPAVLIELDRHGLSDELFNAYLYQVLVDGVFHADPHPGNLSLTPDHRIALLDFGLVVKVSTEMRAHLIRLLLAIADGHGNDAARVAEEAGARMKQFDSAEFRRRISRIVSENIETAAEDLNAGRVIMEIQRAAGDTGLVLADEMVMLGKTLMNLDKVVSTLCPDFNPNDSIRKHTSQILQEHSKGRLSKATLYQSLLESAEFAQQLPGRANRLFESLANNEFEVHVKAIDETKLLRGLHKVANRIAAGLVIAALILGATRMMQLETEWMIFGYPALALFFFLTSAVAGIVLYWKATFQDEKDT